MLSSTSSERSTALGSRPVKLRSACDLCFTAKVKCSGERSGCERCRNAGVACVYLESRVGKVQGNRAKRKNSRPLVPRPERPASPPTTFTEPDLSQTTSFVNTDHNDILSWGGDMRLPSPPNEPEYMSGSDSTMAGIDFNLNELLQSPPPTEQPSESTSAVQPAMPLSLGLRPRNDQDSQCVLECCKIIADLENYIMADLKVFKLLICIIKKALDSQTTLIGLQQGSRNLRCLFLFSTILYQVLEMLESSVANAWRESSRAQGSSDPPSSAAQFPRLAFGDFEMDPEDRLAWQLRTVSREVNHAIEVLKKLKSLSGIGPEDESRRGDDLGDSREGCYLDLEMRYSALSSRISPSI